MSELHRHLEDYLRLRRALGFKLEFPGHVLPSLIGYLEAAGAATITAELAVAWAGLPRGVQPITWAHRLGAARGFARYLKTIDPAAEIPPAGIWPSSAPRPRPWIWADEDIGRLLGAARALRPPLRAATQKALFGLVAATGLRLGEAIGLDKADADLDGGVLTIRDGKFGLSRLVPVHPSVTSELREYAAAGTGYAPARQQHGFSSPPPARRCAPAWSTTPSPSSPRHSACALRHAVPGFMI
jgi:integrase/recombinase XerD